jgi:hypothetical protein
MLCETVLPLLSEFFDGVLDADTAAQVSQHLSQCQHCRRELDSFADLHNRLRSLDRMQAPEYLRRLVQRRIAREPWRARVRNELSRYWSIIRTTEGMWYATRVLGTIMAAIFFLTISSAITPFYLHGASPVNTTGWPSLRAEVGVSVLNRLGMTQPPLKMAGRSGPAAINDLYLVEYGQKESASREAKDDSFSVVTVVDRSGSAKVQSVIQPPSDKTLLSDFNEMISSARCRPASENGQAVPSHLVLTFSKIFVYE